MPTLDFPASPTVGQEHDHDGSIWMWDGSKWMAVMPEDPSVVISEQPPAEVPAGTIWFDSATAQTLVLYGNSWVEIGTVQGDTGPGVIDSDEILVNDDGSLMLVNGGVTINGKVVMLGKTLNLNTDDIPEGVSNLYHTDGRSRSVIANAVTNGTFSGGISVSYNQSGNALQITHQPPSSSIGTNQLQSFSVSTDKIQIESITYDRLANGAVIENKLGEQSVTQSKIGESAVTTVKVQDAAITEPKLADDSVTTAKIADAAITTDLIANSAVTTSKIATSAITTARLANAAVTQDKLSPAPVILNLNAITTNYTIPTGYNGMSAGPITVADGVTVTIADGSSWSIV